jgi:hypothetical protein
MKLTVRRPVTKFARFAAVVGAAIACVACVTTIAAAAATHPGSAGRPAAATASGWHLRLSVAPGITEAAVCEYAAAREGDDCTLWLGYSDKVRQVLAATSRAYTGHIDVIWDPAEFNVTQGTAYATAGHWNECSVPSGSGTLVVTAENGVPNCD